MAGPNVTIADAEGPAQLQSVRTLFVEYATGLGFSLCFQNFDQEIENLPGNYGRPDGRLLLATVSSAQLKLRPTEVDVGCVGLRRIGPHICEMKRLYVRPGMRANGVGRALARAVIAQAREIGYQTMRLDTVEPLMPEAVALYRTLGFHPIAPYTSNPIEGALYMELDLSE